MHLLFGTCRRSEEVAQRLLPAYNTTTGIPFNTINLKTLVSRLKGQLGACTAGRSGRAE